jgi:hypothetical protein
LTPQQGLEALEAVLRFQAPRFTVLMVGVDGQHPRVQALTGGLGYGFVFNMFLVGLSWIEWGWKFLNLCLFLISNVHRWGLVVGWLEDAGCNWCFFWALGGTEDGGTIGLY